MILNLAKNDIKKCSVINFSNAENILGASLNGGTEKAVTIILERFKLLITLIGAIWVIRLIRCLGKVNTTATIGDNAKLFLETFLQL